SANRTRRRHAVEFNAAHSHLFQTPSSPSIQSTHSMAEQNPETQTAFPTTRMRRLRHHPAMRELTRLVRLAPANFVLPLFVKSGNNLKQEIRSMPGHFQWSVDRLGEAISEIAELGLGGV